MQTILEIPKYTVVNPQDSITAANAHLLERQLTLALKQKTYPRILVDLRQVEYIDSSGLMTLISAWKLAQDLRTRFSLCSLSPSLRIILEVTQLDHIFEIFDSQTKYKEMLQ